MFYQCAVNDVCMVISEEKTWKFMGVVFGFFNNLFWGFLKLDECLNKVG